MKSAKVLKTRMHQQNVLNPSIIQLLYKKKMLKFSMRSAKTSNCQDLNKINIVPINLSGNQVISAIAWSENGKLFVTGMNYEL